MTKKSSKRATSNDVFVEGEIRVADVTRLKIKRAEAKALRAWAKQQRLSRPNRAPRWLARMQQAQRIVAAATEAHGKERYDLLVDAAKIVAALREPRTDSVPFELLTFQRSANLLAVAISKLGGWVGSMATGVPLADKRLYARYQKLATALHALRPRRTRPRAVSAPGCRSDVIRDHGAVLKKLTSR